MVREVKPGIYECSGRVEIENLRESFHIDIPEDDDYQTLAGYILHHVGEIPAEGDRIEINGKTFTIEKGSATRLELIRLEDNPKTED
jgi:CBS domain containing-hemolysin-like protein